MPPIAALSGASGQSAGAIDVPSGAMIQPSSSGVRSFVLGRCPLSRSYRRWFSLKLSELHRSLPVGDVPWGGVILG